MIDVPEMNSGLGLSRAMPGRNEMDMMEILEILNRETESPHPDRQVIRSGLLKVQNLLKQDRWALPHLRKGLQDILREME